MDRLCRLTAPYKFNCLLLFFFNTRKDFFFLGGGEVNHLDELFYNW